MANIGFVNTWGPGGQRRGPIWVSGAAGSHHEDERWLLMPPYLNLSNYRILDLAGQNVDLRVPEYAGAGLVQLDLGNYSYSDIIGQISYPFADGTITRQDSQGRNYVALLATEQTRVYDVNITVDPQFSQLCDSSGNPLAPEHIVGSPDNYNNTLQMTSGKNYYNKAYYTKTSGENYGSADTYLDPDRYAFPSCPMHIRGTLVVSDYGYAVSSIENGGSQAAAKAIFPVTLIDTVSGQLDNILETEFANRYISQLNLRQYYMGKCYMNSKYSNGSFYDNWRITGLSSISDLPLIDQSNNWGTSATSHKYEYSKGCLYGTNPFQFYISPIMYPAYRNMGSVGTSTDYILNLRDDGSQASYVNQAIALFTKHSKPGFLSPTYISPVLTARNSIVSPAVNSWVDSKNWKWTGDGTTHLRSDNYFNSSSHQPWLSGLGGSGKPSNSGLDAIACYGTTNIISSEYNTPGFVFNETGIADLYNEAALQPIIVKGEQYLQDVDVKCVRFNTSTFSSNGRTSGRYKYMRFKGCVSYFAKAPGT